MQLAFFPEPKAGDSVVLAGTAAEMTALAKRVRDFASSSEAELPLHSLSSTASADPVLLFLCRNARGWMPGFRWALTADIEEKLEALATSDNGHQYFSLAGTATQLIVSVGEYSADWKAHG